MLRQLPSRLFRYWDPTHVVSMLSACCRVKCQVEARDAVPCINEPVDAGRFLFECKDLEESHWRVLGIHGKVKIVIGCEVTKTLTSPAFTIKTTNRPTNSALTLPPFVNISFNPDHQISHPKPRA